jgi:hypothetical protein
LLEYLPIIWAVVAILILIRKRGEIIESLRRLPIWARIGIGALLIACAFIPGPIDDLIVIALIAKIAKS